MTKSNDWKRARQQERQNKQAQRNIFSFSAAEKRDGIEKR